MKLQELEKSVEDLVEEQNIVNDAYYIQSTKEATHKKPFEFNFNFVNEDTMYNPVVMSEAGFKKLFMRPKITLSEDRKYNAEITIGGKRAKIENDIWYQIDIKDIEEAGTNVKFKLTPEYKTTPTVILEFCYMK